MGSSFSVLNDSNKPIWVSHGVCKAALFGSLAGILAVVSLGAGAAALGAGALAEAGTAETIGVAVVAEGEAEAATVGGLTASQWSSLNSVSGLLSAGTGITAGLCGDKKEKVMSAKKRLQETLKDYTRVGPGEKYIKYGSLSLVLTAYVIYDDFKQATHDCWTGPTAGSDNEYPVTDYF